MESVQHETVAVQSNLGGGGNTMITIYMSMSRGSDFRQVVNDNEVRVY